MYTTDIYRISKGKLTLITAFNKSITETSETMLAKKMSIIKTVYAMQISRSASKQEVSQDIMAGVKQAYC